MEAVKGKITKIMNYGAFVTVEGGRRGMIHISEVSTEYVKDINDFLKEGQDIEAAVISEDENGRLSLSLKKLAPKAVPVTAQPVSFYTDEPEHDRTFEDMMSRFKSISDDKFSDLKKGHDGGRYNGKTGKRKH